MNIDPTGLEEVAKLSLEKSLSSYNKAHKELKQIVVPRGCDSYYKEDMNMLIGELITNIEDLIVYVDEYVQALKEANISTEKKLTEQEGAMVIETGTIAMESSRNEEKNPITSFFENGMEAAGKFFNMLFNPDAQEDVDVRKNMSMATENSTMTAEEIKDSFVSIGATLCTGVVAALDGIATFFENVGDAILMSGAYQQQDDFATQAMWLEMFGNESAANELRQMGRDTIEGTMEIVEENYVEAGLDILYSQEFMQKINENSYVKRGDTIYLIIEGVAYYVPVSVAEAVIPGSGTALSFVAGTGKAEAEYLTEMKMNSKEGITREYEEGKISKETYEFYKNVWNMPDEEFQSICMKKITGEITDEEFEYIENIRNMPNEWTTVENANKAMAGGVMIGAWEATQWIAGVKLNKLNTLFGSKGLASTMRVGLDTGFNATDTAYRALVDTIVFDKDFGEAFEDRGGYISTGINAAIGLVGSGIGEVIELKKSKNKGSEKVGGEIEFAEKQMKSDDIVFVEGSESGHVESDLNRDIELHIGEEAKQNMLTRLQKFTNYLSVETERANLLREKILKDIESGRLNIAEIPAEKMGGIICDYDIEVAEELFKNKGIFAERLLLPHLKEMEALGKTYGACDSFFYNESKNGNSYGVSQGVMKEHYTYKTPDGLEIKPGTPEYKKALNEGIPLELKIIDSKFEANCEILQTKYGFSYKDASKVLRLMDTNGGLCSNASFLSELVYDLRENPDRFKEITGVNMYVDRGGQKVLNYDEALIDLFVKVNEGNIVKTLPDGTRQVIKDTNKAMSLGAIDTLDGTVSVFSTNINKYLGAEGATVDFDRGIEIRLTSENMPSCIKEVMDSLENGKSVELTVARAKNNTKTSTAEAVHLDPKDNGALYTIGDAAHTMFVTGVSPWGVVVDSWGRRMLIRYTDFEKIELSNFIIRESIK